MTTSILRGLQVSGFELVDDGGHDKREAHFKAWLESQMGKAKMDGDALAMLRLMRMRLARNRTPAQEVEALLASLKTEGGFTREVKWGK